jgi:hypothetical protein
MGGTGCFEMSSARSCNSYVFLRLLLRRRIVAEDLACEEVLSGFEIEIREEIRKARWRVSKRSDVGEFAGRK